jgi:hypothetical protein
MSMLPEDPESTILKRLKKRPEDTETPENSTDRHSQLDQPAAQGETGIAQGPGNRALR